MAGVAVGMLNLIKQIQSYSYLPLFLVSILAGFLSYKTRNFANFISDDFVPHYFSYLLIITPALTFSLSTPLA